MKHRDPKLNLLSTLPIFSECNTKELTQIAALGDRVTVPAERVLHTEGGHPDEAYVVISGEAIVSRNGEEIARVGAGELLGEMSVIGQHGSRSATVTAATEMELLVFAPREFAEMLHGNEAVARQVNSTSTERLNQLDTDTR